MSKFLRLRLASCVLGLIALASSAATNDLAVAREALRDGLWSVARTHASKVDDDTGRRIVLETYAQEENWKGLLAAYEAMGRPSGDGFAYYRAVALFKSGARAAATNVLAAASITNAAFARPVARLKAELALANRDPGAALALLEGEGGDDVETKLMIASIRADSGNLDESNKLWREVVANTNNPERCRAQAAAGLRDVDALRTMAASAKSSAVRRFAALRLGVELVKGAETFAEGERIVREAVRDMPDAAGAQAAFLAVAEARLARKEYAEAEKTYFDALQIWPDLVRDAALREGRGIALLKLGQAKEALEEFRQAEELATTNERKAAAAVRVADALAAAGAQAEATDAYERVVRVYPKTAAAETTAKVIRLRALEERARALYRGFKFDEAGKAFEALAKEDPARREALAYCQVLCAYGSGDDGRAEKGARELMAGATDAAVRAAATHWLAKHAFNRGRWQEAERLFAAYADAMPQAADAPQALAWSARAALADNDFASVVSNAAKLVSRYPESPARAAGMRTQGEALIELARFDEAVLVLDRAALVPGVSNDERLAARTLRADALFAMGADNPSRYKAALEAYGEIRTGAKLSPDDALTLAFKVAKTLEKLGRLDDAIDAYYTQVVLAYRTGRVAGTVYGEEARAAFARAAFRLAEIYESRGRARQAMNVLELVRTSDVPAASEAARRIEKLEAKQ